MKPTIGRVVIYNLIAPYKYRLNTEEKQFPAIIVKVHNATCIDIKVFTNTGEDILVREACQGDTEGNWNWPVINK